MEHSKMIFDEKILIKKTKSVYNIFFKRCIDIILSLILIIMFLPLLIIITLVQIVTSGFPVLYKPNRGGYMNKQFRIYKFRTMVKNADKLGGGTTALNDKRITKFGYILRKTKMDEIPQLFNILFGKMSFIGPRPELIEYTKKYEGLEKYILNVKPGITDYSSMYFINLDEVVGSENADEIYENKILKVKNQLRIKYVYELSFFTDLKIFFNTIGKVLKKILKLFFGGKNGKN